MQELHLQERQKRNTPKIKDCFSIHWEKPLLIFIRCCKKQNIKTSGGVNVLSDISCKLHSTMGKKTAKQTKNKAISRKIMYFLLSLQSLFASKLIIVVIKNSSLWDYLSVFIWVLFIPLSIIHQKSHSK